MQYATWRFLRPNPITWFTVVATLVLATVSLPQSGGAFEVTNSVFAGGGESRRIRISCVLSWTYALTDNLLRKKWDLLEDFFLDAN